MDDDDGGQGWYQIELEQREREETELKQLKEQQTWDYEALNHKQSKKD
jgi:hypothetical protein